MFIIYRNYKRLSIWILLFLQVLLIWSYFALKVDNDQQSATNSNNEKISFIHSNSEEQPQHTYHVKSSKIFLKTLSTRQHFMDFNSSLCYLNGTDVKDMQRSNRINWQCKCLPGWHGKDCGQPEIIWRAFLTHKKLIKLNGPRPFQRRIIYAFPVDRFSETLAEIRINELDKIVDLFILYEVDDHDADSSYFKHKLDNFFLKPHQHKILYIKENDLDNVFDSIKNLQDDDIILHTNFNEIPNKFAVNFLKYYNNWPQPLLFRLRWSVFGFFWVHPKKTLIRGGACTVAHFRDFYMGKISLLSDNRRNHANSLILGDLNHLGGWFCEFCYDINQILAYLQSKQSASVNIEQLHKVDNAFLEDVIENGLYIDGKTELRRARKYSDNYFAPFHVLENNWKYDYLLVNFYSKIDYYEG